MSSRNMTPTGIHAAALSLLAGSTIGLLPSAAVAGPQGEHVVRGNVNIQRSGSQTTITASRNAIINFRSFDIAGTESVRFIQPDAASRVLNRIQGPSPTRIDGSLTANGRVYIVNPAGVVFGANSVVNTAGLTAAAGHLSDRDFLRGVDRFTGVSGAVINQGVIDAGSVTLVGAAIENTGTIVADGGVVTMMVGTDVMVREADGRIMARLDGREVEPTRPPAPRRGRVASLGAGDAVAMAFTNSGTIRAAGGSVTVAASGSAINTGTISTSVESGRAGSVVVTAPSVVNAAVVAADAASGHAGAVTLTSTNSTRLASGSVTSASGTGGNADGGRLLVHSYQGDTVMERGATVDISGGALGGHGGSGEV
jgi:filamentous hemagglutinin family protein